MSDNHPHSSFSSDGVEITKRQTIKPSSPTQGIFRLSPLDQLVLTFIPVAVIYVYPQSSSSTSAISIEKLHKATSIILDTYPHLAGRLGVDPQYGGVHIRNTGTGCEILEAKSSRNLEEYKKDGTINLLDLPGKGEDLLAPYDFRNTPIEDQVVFTIQHTRFACGGVSLGIRILHCLNDGGGFFQLVKDLSDVYRNLDNRTLGVEPIAQPYLANWESEAREDQKKDARTFTPVLYHLDPESESEPKPEPGSQEETEKELAAPDIPISPPTPATPPTITGQVFHFTTSDLERLKQLATPTSGRQGGYVTTFDALTAHLHQRIYQARSRFYISNPSFGALGDPDLLCPIDLRNHLGLGDRYPYNAVFTTSTQFPSDLLLDPKRLSEVASMVHSQVRPLGSGDAEKTVKWIASADRSRIRHGFRGGNGSVMVSQWNKMDMYNQAIFEEGLRPILVAPPFTPISLHDGLGYTLPTESGDGIAVYLALRDGVWDELDVSV